MGTDVASSSGVGIHGYMKLEMVNEKTGSTVTLYKNTVTSLGKLLMLARSVNTLLQMPSSIGRGNYVVNSPFSRVDIDSPTPPTPMYSDDVDHGLTAYLLNTTASLSSASNFLPVYDNNFNFLPANVVGYASFRRTFTNAKEGVIDLIKDADLIDDIGCHQRWKFDTTQANGTINAVAIGANIMKNRFNGWCIAKGMNQLDYQNVAGVSAPNDSFFRPGITGLTANNEILLCLDGTNKTTHVANLDTGTVTALNTGDARKGITLPLQGSPQIIVNGYLYYFGGVTSGTYYVYSINLTTLAINTNVFSTNYYANNFGSLSLFEYNGYLYTYGAANSATTWSAYTTAGVYTSAQNLTLAQMNLPSDFPDNIAITNLQELQVVGTTGRYHITVIPAAISSASTNYSLYSSGITVTSIVNCSTTIVDIKPHIATSTIYPEGASNNDYAFLNPVFNDFKTMDVYDITNAKTYYAVDGHPYVSKGWWGNMISFVTLSSAVTKTSADVLYLSYGYQFT